MYVERVSGQTALQAAVIDISAGALAYDTIPLTSAGRLDPFSPQFQSMTLEKGAMVFHMLRWEIGDDNFHQDAAGDCHAVRRQSPSAPGTWKRWPSSSLSSSSRPSLRNGWMEPGRRNSMDKYTVYRLGNNKGFRTIGEIGQDLDLFNMPVELRVETEGKTEVKRVDVVGTNSQYVVDTFGRPRHIAIDPDNWVLKNTPDLQVRIAILRGQQLVAAGRHTGALAEYQKALTANPNSSLASYRIGEVLFNQTQLPGCGKCLS